MQDDLLPVTLLPATPWQAVVSAYLDAACDSPATRRAYGRHLREAFAALGAVTVAELTGAQLAAYRATVTSSALAPGSQALALAAIRSFLRWSRSLGAHALPAEVIAVALRTPKAEVRRPYAVLTDAEIGRVFAAAHSARDRALLAVLLGCGLRAAEVCALELAEVSEDADGYLLRVHGKGRKERLVPAPTDVAQLVLTYLRADKRRLGDRGPLFLAEDRRAGQRTTRLSTRAVGYLVERTMRAAGIDTKRISPHSLRHTMAIRSLRGGANIVSVQRLLGHASIQTTTRYTNHLELSELRQAMPRLPSSD